VIAILIFAVKVLPRHTTNKEDGVDEFLHAQALNSILKSKIEEDMPGLNTLVLVTGTVPAMALDLSIRLLEYLCEKEIIHFLLP
jgi:hypothetical protein